MYKLFLKRISDIFFALLVLLLASPIILIVFFCLLIANKGEPFFYQERSGKAQKVFRIIKFKTMNSAKDDSGNLLCDAERLTRIGAFVRKTSLDELPQLINVLKGDMSLIGPRPLLLRYLPYYTKRERIRHEVRPGITGWAQVNGRNTIKWDERLALDVDYVNNLTFGMDLMIILLTIKCVFKSTNIIIDPSSIMNDLDYERKSRD